MSLRKILGLFVCVLILSNAALATAELPDPIETTAHIDGIMAGQSVSLFNLPDGGGSSFSEAQIFNDGTVVDGTITMYVRNAWGNAIADFPAEDMWIESVDGGMVPCSGSANADVATDANGYTYWAEPLNASGWSLADCVVYVNGLVLNQLPFQFYFNSADIDANGAVTLPDVTTFSGFFYGSYHFSADFSADGVLNLVDVTRLANGLGTACP